MLLELSWSQSSELFNYIIKEHFYVKLQTFYQPEWQSRAAQEKISKSYETLRI